MTPLPTYPKIAAGKVRDLYAVGEEQLLLVVTDRISAFDHVLETEVPGKGRVLTAMSVFWFAELADVLPHHVLSHDDVPEQVRGRALLVRRLEMLPVEAVVRGYLAGTGYDDYRRTGAVCGVTLPPGLTESARLPEPIFTPALKGGPDLPDVNIDFETLTWLVGRSRAEELREVALELYRRGAARAAEKGLLVADTKFEFGVDADGSLVLADEVLTPDSARYWPADGYRPGRAQPSFDKQHVRDWLVAAGWDRSAGTPPPPLPPEVVTATRAQYVAVYERVTGLSLADWPA